MRTRPRHTAVPRYAFGWCRILLNFKLHHPSGAKAHAAYLYRGATSLAPDVSAALEYLASDGTAIGPALEAFSKIVRSELYATYQEQMDELRRAFLAAGETEFAGAVATIAALHPLDWERFDELSEGLRVSLIASGQLGPLKALDEVLDIKADIETGPIATDWAYERLMETIAAIRAPEFSEAFPVQFHMSDGMRQLLGVNSDLPSPETVAKLLMNRTADGGHIPGKFYKTPDARARPVSCFELVFSPGKTVSVTAAFSDPHDQTDIRRAHDASVTEAMKLIEDRVAWRQLGRAGQSGRERGEAAWITFLHSTSRRGDPQLHTHVALLNVVRSLESDKVGSLDLKQLRGEFRSIRAAYHQELATRLSVIGFDAFYDHDRIEARIRGIPDRVVDAFSRRTSDAKAKAIEWLLREQKSFQDLTPAAQSAILTKAAAATRRPASQSKPDFEEWRAIAIALGWQPAVSHSLQQGRAASDETREPHRNPAAGLGGYHRGGSDDLDWGLAR